MSSSQATTREGLDQDGQDSETASAITVNLAEKDLTKAIERHELATDNDGAVDRAPRNHKERKDEFGKRIGRLRSEFSQEMAERDALHQREIRDLRGKLDKLELNQSGSSAAADEAAHTAKIAELETKLAAALEQGESALVAKLQTQISTENAKFFSEQTAKRLGEAYNADKAAEKGQRTDKAGKTNGTTPMGKRFLSANRDWWDDPANRRKQAAVIDIDRELLGEGFDPNTEEYYEELQARFNDDFPKFNIALPGERRRARDEDDDEDDEPEHRRRPVVRNISASANRGSGGRPAGSNRGQVSLSQSDIANMERFGMDPNNPKHVLNYAAEKQG